MASEGNGKGLLSFETAVNAVTVADVQLSPDGRQVVYVTGRASIEKETPPTGALWLMSAGGGQARRLTSGEVGDGSPRWSPDSKKVAFISDRKQRGTGQLYLLDLELGGEAVRLTDHKAGVMLPEWAPNGRTIAYLAPDAPDEEEQKRKQEHDQKVIDADVTKVGLWVVTVPDSLAAIGPDALPEAKRISPEGMHISTGFSWAPDSAGFAAAHAKSPKLHDTLFSELITIDLQGEIKSLGILEGFGKPVYSPDGSTIAFNGAEEVVPALFSLQTIPATGGKPTILMPGFNGSFMGDCVWLPDGSGMLTIVEEGQRHRLAALDPETHSVTDAIAPLEKPGTIGTWFGAPLSLSADGRRVAFVFSDSFSLGDIYVADLGGEARKLTDLNPWTRDYQWGEMREERWTSFDGLEIEGLLILPVGYQEGQRYPTLLQIHGGPMGAWGHHLYANWHDWGQFLAQRGYAVLMPNPRGSSGRGTEFLCGIVNCYGEPDFQDLITGIDHLIELGITDPDKLVVGGWSGGGFLTNWTVTHSDRFKAAVSGAGIANWVSFQGTADCRSAFDRYYGRVDEDPDNHWQYSPVRSIKNAVTPTLILYGENDARVPPSQGHEMYEGLKSRNVEAQLVLYPREGHIINERLHQLDLLERVVGWFDSHLGR